MSALRTLVRTATWCGIWAAGTVMLEAQGPVLPAGGDASWVAAQRSTPGGAPGSSVINLEQWFPREVRTGQTFDYRMRVTNFADCPVSEVTVLQHLPQGVSILGSYPQAEVRDRIATWRLGTLAVHESRTIQVRGTAGTTGPLTFCCDTQYRAPSCVTIASTQPELFLGIESVPEATPCDVVPVRVAVQNRGTGQCTDVRVGIRFPPGMTGPDGGREYAFHVPVLAAGQIRRTEIHARVESTGTYRCQATAVSAEGLRVSADSEVLIVAPRLSVTQTGTATQFAGRDVTYTFVVRNDGDAPARNVIVEDTLPAGAQVVALAPDAAQSASGGTVTWHVTELRAGAAMDFSVTVRSGIAGRYANHVSARADCAGDASATHSAQVQGIAAILLEVIDEEDPIEVGSTETYIITATNQGSAVGTGITIRCTLEDNVKYVSSDGPTLATVSGNDIAFAPLAYLAPKAAAVWVVTCRALTEGDVRFRVQLTSDQLTRPVEETEATRIY